MGFEIRLEEPANNRDRANREPWSDPGFLDVVARTHDLQAWLLTCYKGEELVASLPLYERSRFGIKYLVEPVTAYYQPLQFFLPVEQQQSRRHLDELRVMEAMAAFLKDKYRRLHIKLHPGTLDTRAFIWAGMRATPFYTFIHKRGDNLDPVKDEQRNLKLAGDRGYSYSNAFVPEAFFALFRRMHERKERRFSLSLDKMQAFCSSLHNLGLMHQSNVLLDDKIVSADLFLGKGSGTAYLLHRASSPEEMPMGVSAWHSSRLLEELTKDYELVDFCGANVREVARFKAALGLQLAVFFQIEYGSKII
jgi:hypothetical protein